MEVSCGSRDVIYSRRRSHFKLLKHSLAEKPPSYGVADRSRVTVHPLKSLVNSRICESNNVCFQVVERVVCFGLKHISSVGG